MNWNNHSNLEGLHAFLSPSSYHWLNYDDEKLLTVYANSQAKALGTRLHAFACEAIKLGIKLPKSKRTLNAYVNDAIGYRMTPEQVLYFSENCFGTADAISFDGRLLRIHDLKTGDTPAHIEQLYIYAALFCMEYNISPSTINFELRIYQHDDVAIDTPDGDAIQEIIDIIRHADNVLFSAKREEV